MTTATATKRPRAVPPCSDCGTLEGRVDKGAVQPARRDGSKYGFGPICATCYNRHYAAAVRRKWERTQKRLGNLCPKLRAKRCAARVVAASELLYIVSPCRCGTRRYRFARSCDLCGVGTPGIMYSGSEYDLEGKICRRCRDELRDERAVERLNELTQKPYVSPIRDTHGRRAIVLPVLTEGFTADDLTPRAACRLMVVQFDRRLSEPRRASA